MQGGIDRVSVCMYGVCERVYQHLCVLMCVGEGQTPPKDGSDAWITLLLSAICVSCRTQKSFIRMILECHTNTRGHAQTHTHTHTCLIPAFFALPSSANLSSLQPTSPLFPFPRLSASFLPPPRSVCLLFPRPAFNLLSPHMEVYENQFWFRGAALRRLRDARFRRTSLVQILILRRAWKKCSCGVKWVTAGVRPVLNDQLRVPVCMHHAWT